MTSKELFGLPAAKPRFIEPMHPSAVRDLPEGRAWTYEAKLDGYRCLAAKDGKVTLWSRRGTLFTVRFADVANACEKLPVDTVLDGEVVAIDENGRASFNLLQHHASKPHLQFYAFDMPVYRGRNLTDVPLEKRRALLEDASAKVDYPVIFSRTFEAKPADLIRAAKELKFGGIVAKKRARFTCRADGPLPGSNTR
jgi:bifunctional non-homologous end joining protein LigD